jgi:hypothetical protein
LVENNFTYGHKLFSSIFKVQYRTEHLLAELPNTVQYRPEHWLAEPPTLYTAALGTAWSLLGSQWKAQSVLYRFQKHLLF